MVKNLPACGDTCGFYPWVRKIPCRKAWKPTLVFLTGECHRQRSLAGYSPQGCKELDMTEATEHACMHILCREAKRLKKK